MVNAANQEVKQLIDQACGLSLGTDDFLIAIRTDTGELEPQLVGKRDDFLQRLNGFEGADEIRHGLRVQDRRGPFVGMLHRDGAATFEFPRPVVPEHGPPRLTDELIPAAIQAAIRVGEIYLVHLCDGGTGMYVEFGLQKLSEFMWEYGHCFLDSRRKPSKQRAYLAIAWGRGNAFLVEV